jgi:hypothetical protein
MQYLPIVDDTDNQPFKTKDSGFAPYETSTIKKYLESIHANLRIPYCGNISRDMYG